MFCNKIIYVTHFLKKKKIECSLMGVVLPFESVVIAIKQLLYAAGMFSQNICIREKQFPRRSHRAVILTKNLTLLGFNPHRPKCTTFF